MLEEFGKKHRMPPGDEIRFATLCELGCGIPARGVKQPVVCRSVDNGRGNQGLRNQVRNRISNVRFVCLRLGRNGAGRLKREVPDEN